jgi:hypothetical protein
MKTPIKQTAHRLAAVLAIITALATTGAWAATTTYYQVAGTRDASCVFAADGLASDVEITSTPQLAFPGITLDDIPARATFYTTIYGDGVVGEDMTAVGMHENRHYSAGHADKIALQCAVYDSSWIKGVVLVFTNGDGGVYVQVFGRIKKNGQYLANRYYDMAADGTLSSRWLNSGEFWTGSYPSGEEGEDVFRAKGLRIHGLSPSSTEARKALAFPGVKVADIADCVFVSGRRDGLNLSSTATDNLATYVTRWPAEGVATKLVMQFEHPTDSKKAAIIQLVNGEDGVYAFQSHHTWNGNDNIQRFAVDADTGTVSTSNTGGSSGATSADPPNYAVHDLYLRPPCVTKTPNKIKVFSDPSKTLALDDIQNGDFTARMCGGWMPASSRETHNTGYNKKVYTDETSGSVTNIIVEFQVRDDSNTKCLVVAFTNGADGIYAEAINARYSTQAIGYEFRDYDGTLYGAQNNKSGEIVAETLTAGGYGAFDLRVTAPTVHKWTLDATKDWSTLSGGETVEADEVVKITVNDPAAVLTVDADVSVGKIEFVGGNCAQLIVTSGKTLTAGDISGVAKITNNGTLVKTGDGTVAWPFDRDSEGETVVSNGTLKAASVTGNGTGHVVRVKEDATFDVNGVQNIHVVVKLEEGATYTNGKVYNSHLYNALLPVRLILDGDAVAATTYAFGLNGPSRNGSWLELGKHTLTVNGGKVFMMYKTTVTGTGTVVVDNGELVSYDLSQGDDWTLDVRANGTVSINGAGLTVGNFVNGGSCSGTAKLTVKGMLTPGSAAIANLTLADGATVKATGTAQVVSTTFAASGVITVDASEITKAQLDAGDVPVLTVPTAQVPSGVPSVSGAPIDGTRAKWRTDEGGATKTLYVGKSTGLMVIFR